MTNAYKTSHPRGPNAILAHAQRLESADGSRVATGRNVKGEGKKPGTFVAVEVWRLKERRDGKLVTVNENCDRAEAQAWIDGAGPDTRPGTSAAVNAALKRMGAAERLVKGRGYCYFTEGEAMDWPTSSVMVNRMSQLTVGEWIEEYKRLKAAHEADKR